MLRPDPVTGTLTVLKGCLRGNEALAQVAALETYSDTFGLKVEQVQREESAVLEGGEIIKDVAASSSASSSNTRRAKSPRRPLRVDNSSNSPSPARNKTHRMAFRTEEEEGDDLDTLHLLENLLPPLPTLLLSDNAPPSMTQASGNALSPRRSTTTLPSSSYFPLQTLSASQKRLESQLEASGLAELRSQRDDARREIYSLLKEKRKALAGLEQRIRYDAQRLLGRRSRSSSKEEVQRLSRMDAESGEELRDDEEDDAEGQSSPLFERKRALPASSSDMVRGSSQNSLHGDNTAVISSAGTSSLAMPGRGSVSTAATSNIGSYLSASFAMRGRDLPQAPLSPSLAKGELQSKEDEDEWYAQKRRLRERYPHADHSELPSEVNSDDESNVELKKEPQSDEDEEQRGRERRPARGPGAAKDATKEQRGRRPASNAAEPIKESDESAVSGVNSGRQSSEEEASKSSSVKKGALKGNAPIGSDARLKEKASAGGEKKVAFVEVPRPAVRVVQKEAPKELADESADAVFEIDEEIEGEGTSMSSDVSLDSRALAMEKEKDALQIAKTEDEMTTARQADLEEAEEPRGSIAQSLPLVGSFAAMASLSGMSKARESDEDFFALEEADDQFDPASLRLEGDSVVIDSTASILPSISSTRGNESTFDKINDTSIYGSRPRPSRKDSSDIGSGALLTGFPQPTKQQSSTIGFRVAVGEAEAQLSGLLAPYAPSHRNLWTSADKSRLRLNGKEAVKYKTAEEIEGDEVDEERAGMAWQRRHRDTVSPETDALARSVPIGATGSPQTRRLSMASVKSTTFKDATSGFDLEPKTSLPYREKKYTPSLRKVTRYLTAPALAGGPRSSLATISDSSEAGGSAGASVMSLFEAGANSRSIQSSVPASIARGFTQGLKIPGDTDAMPTSTQSTPGLASKGSEVDPFANVRSAKKPVTRGLYTPPPPPSTYDLRLEPSEENRPRPLRLGILKVQEGYPDEGSDHLDNVDKDLEFMHTLEQLKTNKRTGWFHHRVSRPESIADHMYRMALLSMLLPNDVLDIGKCVQLCLVHDIAEALVGDLTPLDGVSKEEKLRREKEALLYLVHDLLQSSHAALRLEQLWMEYEDRETLESKAVKDLDRFELCLQAVEYERRYNITDLQPFFEGSIGQVTHPLIRKWAAQLAKEREQLWAQTPYKYQQENVDVTTTS